MTGSYSNPRYGQAFMGYKGANLGLLQTYVYPLAPDPDAYSIRPPAGTYPERLNYAFRTSQYTSGDAVSKCALVKDGSDVFYYICSYKSGATLRIYIDVYDGALSSGTSYQPTVPTEFTNDYNTSETYIAAQCWFVARVTETDIDFVVVGDDVNAGVAGAKVVIQQYRWTIGSSTLTYITKYEYLVDGTASALGSSILGMALISDQIIIMNRKTYSGETYWYVVEFTLDSGGTDSQFVSTVGMVDVSAAFFPAGGAVHTFAIYGTEATDTKECEGYLGSLWTMPIKAEVWATGYAYGLGTNYSKKLATYSGRMAATIDCSIWPEYGCNPDTGEVYFRLQYTGQGSDDEDCGECGLTPPATCPPETVFGTRAYWSLPGNASYLEWNESVAFGGSLTWDKNAGEYHEPGWWPVTTAGGLPQDTWFRFGFPSRNSNPTSLLYTNGAPDHSFVLDWATLDEYLIDQLTESGLGGSRITEGAGQRNDNLPALYTYRLDWDSQWGSVFIDKNNAEYSRVKTYLGEINNPITGTIGLYLVYEKRGRWIILGAVEEPALPRWQCV